MLEIHHARAFQPLPIWYLGEHDGRGFSPEGYELAGVGFLLGSRRGRLGHFVAFVLVCG